MARKPVGHEGFARRKLHEERSRAVEQVVLTVGGARFVPFEAGPLPFAVGIGERNGVGGVPVDAAHGRLHRSGQSVAVVEAHDHRHLVGVEGGVLVAVVPVLADDPVRGLVEPRAPGRAVVRRYDHGGAGVSAGNPLPALREIALQFARLAAEHPADRKSAHRAQVFVGGVDGIIHAVRLPQVEGRALHGFRRPQRHEARVVGQVAVRFDLHHVIHHVAAVVHAFEVEIGVIREVDDRRTVGRGLVFGPPDIVLREPVGDRAGEVARIALFAVGAQAREPHAGPVGFEQRFALPHHAVESLRSAVQMAGPAAQRLVRGEVHRVAVERERGAADAVAVAADQGSEEAFAARFERGDVAVSDHHVVDAAVAVGDADAHHAAAVVDDLHRGAGSVAQTVQRDGLADGEGSERFGRNIGGAGCARGEKSRYEARTNRDDSFHG